MSTKRVLHQDPEYEAIPAELQEKRIKLMEDSVRKQTKKKIENIINVNFGQEKNSKEAEIEAVDETLYECRSTLDRLRACAVTHYYANLGQVQTPSENTSPSIHPTVKNYLGKTPKYMNSDSHHQNFMDNSQESIGTSSSNISCKIPLSHLSNSSVRLSEKVEAQPSFLSPSKDISSRAPRFKTKTKIVIGNISKFIPLWQRDESDQSTHKWMIYVRGDRSSPNIEGFVQKVRFLLHPSYRPTDIVEICNPPFHLDKRGWGEFPVRVQLYFHDPRNKPVDIIHNLKLDKTFTGLQTLGAETVVELQLFKADSNASCSSSFPMLSSVSTLPSTLNFDEPYPESNSSSNPVSIKMEIDIDEDCADPSSMNGVPPAIDESEKLADESSSGAIPSDSLASNENSSDIENNGTANPVLVVPNNSLSSNNIVVGSKPSLKNNTVVNGVNTKFLRCTDPSGRILLVPQSKLVCIKSNNIKVKAAPIPANNNNTAVIVSEKSAVVGVKKALPSYILKVLPVCVPKTEKNALSSEGGVSKEVAANNNMPMLNCLEGDQKHLPTVDGVTLKKPTCSSWEQELSDIKIEYYKSFEDLLKRVCKVFPLVKKDVDRSIFPFCATTLEDFLRWNIGKQRASEWRRAGLVRKTLTSLLHKGNASHLTEECVWTRRKIMSWCRKNGFVPMTSDKMTLLPEPKWSGVELCSVSSADDLLTTLKEEEITCSRSNTDEEEIEILDEIDVKPLKCKNNSNKQHISHLPPLKHASTYIKEVAAQIGIDIRPIELEPSIHGPVIEDMILAACQELATDLLRASVNAGYSRLGGQLCPEEITVSDVYTAIKETPQFDFLSNSYLGVPKESGGDT